jgi:hypothetical protein
MNSFCALYLATELKLVVPTPGTGMVRFRRDQVTPSDQFVALDGGVVVDGPLIILEGLGVVLDTNS